ncbi:hypothetical protein I79_015628 [Cricetulus griseus]|uniref:Uncharacterized protein n=1 Tax=Cricetulus griseus TaxID=10029 RepID=G3HXA9_CRIGR|nr:hypothetical protein I79_015628 [Cricetulus griseus]
MSINVVSCMLPFYLLSVTPHCLWILSSNMPLAGPSDSEESSVPKTLAPELHT